MSDSPWERRARLAFFGVIGVVALYLFVSAFEPMRTNWGDPWSDANAMTSGRHFDEQGFFKLAFTPRVDIGPVGSETLIYTHYPPLPDLVNGFYQRVTGGAHLTLFRIMALLCSGLGLFFFHAFLQRLWGSAVAKLSILAIATNLLFLQYADTLHHIPLYTMFGYGSLAAALAWIDERKRWQLVMVGVCAFFCFIASYDYYFFTPIMLLAAIRFRKLRWFGGPGLKLILVFALCGLLSIVVKNLLAIWAIGTHEWYRDLVFQFLERSTSTYARSYKSGFSQVIFWRLWRFFSPLFFVCSFVQIIAVVDWIRGRTSEVSLQPLTLLIAGVPFVIVFSQLIVEQYHPTLLFLPFAAVSLATVVIAAWKREKRVAALVLAFYLGWQGFQLRLFKKTFLYEDDIAAVQTALKADRHNFLMTNMLVDAPSRYFWERYAIGLLTQPLPLRTQFEVFGTDSPLTLVQIKRVARHAYDKGIYMTFGGSSGRWPWVSRPDYYRNAWKRMFDAADRETDEHLDGVGRIVHESDEMRVRQVTLDDIDRVQRAAVPRKPVHEIDFETFASEAYKLSGITVRTPGTEEMPGYAWLMHRQPTRIIFTLKGFKYIDTGKPIRTSEVLIPLRSPARLVIQISTPIFAGQIVTLLVNGHPLAKRMLGRFDGVVEMAFDVPASALVADGLQRLTIDSASSGPDLYASRLHKIEIEAQPAP